MMAAIYASAEHEANEIYDAQLVHLAKLLLSMERAEVLAQRDGAEIVHETDIPYGHEYEKNILFRIWRGEELRHAPSNVPDLGPRQTQSGFIDTRRHDQPWRLFVVHDPEMALTVETGETYAIREEMIDKILLSMAGPLIGVLILAPLLLSFGLSRGLAPLTTLSDELQVRSPEALSPITSPNLPSEVKPLVESLNGLLETLSGMLEGERRFTDNAAHELRTPLAAIRTYAQAAEGAASPEERKHAIARLLVSTERATHTIEQLLALARLNHAIGKKEPIDLLVLAQEVYADWRIEAESRSQKVELLLQDVPALSSYRGLLRLVLGNLLGNAILYSPSHGEITLRYEVEESLLRLIVEDTGPGIREADVPHIFESFYRGRESGNIQGAGLGLAIVRRACERAGMTIHYEPRLGQGSRFIVQGSLS
jgi:signal transduction histidine kinase